MKGYSKGTRWWKEDEGPWFEERLSTGYSNGLRTGDTEWRMNNGYFFQISNVVAFILLEEKMFFARMKSATNLDFNGKSTSPS